MKKTKMITFRISQKEYDILKKDYLWHKNSPELCTWIYNHKIKTFSDYIRQMIRDGMN